MDFLLANLCNICQGKMVITNSVVNTIQVCAILLEFAICYIRDILLEIEANMNHRIFS